jgi:hypothetical protein
MSFQKVFVNNTPVRQLEKKYTIPPFPLILATFCCFLSFCCLLSKWGQNCIQLRLGHYEFNVSQDS